MTLITVDQELCTRCGICSGICLMGIISPGDDEVLPGITGKAEPFCIRCGHCKVGCPEQALSIRFLPDEEPAIPAGFPPDPELIAYYLKNRRSDN
jgi:heterodisulfide reductase subunit A-like polyferredoxin